MANSSADVIEDILAGCTENSDRYRRYLTRTCWRVEGDVAFLRRAVPNPESVLDVGAVPPMLVGALADIGYHNLTVIDPKVEVFAPYFKRRDIHFVQGKLLSVDEIRLPQKYDLVCLCEVLEHLTGDIVSSLETVSRWVAPEGYFYLTTPNLRSITGAVAIFARGSGLASKSLEPIRKQYSRADTPDGYFGHIREYTEKEVKNLVEGLGFRHVESSFQVHPRAERFSTRVIRALETAFPSLRLFGKYLFQKKV